MPFGISPWELAILLVLVLLLFGAKRLPEIGRSLGSGMREFKDSIAGKGDDRDDRSELPRGTEDERVSSRERDSVSS